MRPIREYYIPKNATKIEAKGIQAVFYLYNDTRGRVSARAFVGKAIKPTWAFWFTNAEQRERKIRETIEATKATADYRAKCKAERMKPSTLIVGQILYSSWGYDQTNIDFYQVTRVISGRTVEIRKIAARDVGHEESGHSSMSTKVVAVPDQFTGEPMTKRTNSTNYVTIESYSSAGPWDGRALYCSWYA